MYTSPADFIKSHHLPGWYDSVVEYTPETLIIAREQDVISVAEAAGWDRYFVKDYVKSNYSGRGSIAISAQDIPTIVHLIKSHRGALEGGICLRRVEPLDTASEVRYFVFNGQVYSPNGQIPVLVTEIAERHTAPFYSLDIVQRLDGRYRLIEIGDGQVSDRKEWDVELFCQMLMTSV